jgi:hypothetical protein
MAASAPASSERAITRSLTSADSRLPVVSWYSHAVGSHRMAIGVAVQLAASPAPTDMGDGRMRGGDGHPGAGGEPQRHRRPPWEGAHGRIAPVEIHARSRGSSTCRPHRGSSTPGVGERCHGRAVPVEIHPPRTVGNLHALYWRGSSATAAGCGGAAHQAAGRSTRCPRRGKSLTATPRRSSKLGRRGAIRCIPFGGGRPRPC